MKYIVIRTNDRGIIREFPIIFPNDFIHKDVADAVRLFPPCRRGVVVAAGELSSMEIDSACHGRSTTLHATSRERTDDKLIRNHDYFHGIVE